MQFYFSIFVESSSSLHFLCPTLFGNLNQTVCSLFGLCSPEQYINISFLDSIYNRINSILLSVPGWKSKFWEGIVSVILSKHLYMYMCPLPNCFRNKVFRFTIANTGIKENQDALITCNTPGPSTSCKMLSYWQWNFGKRVILGKLYQLCHVNNECRY
jgi:hypothetical protein